MGTTVSASGSGSPKMGDDEQPLLWLMLAALSMGSLTVAAMYGRRKARQTKGKS